MKYIRKKRNGIYIMILLMTLLLGGCGMQKSDKLTCADTAMGTIVQQTLYVRLDRGDTSTPEDISQNIMVLLESLEKDTLSWREENSEVCKINMADKTDGYPISDKMQKYLEEIGDVWEKSAGALDVTVGSVSRLWDIDRYVETAEDFRLPVAEELKIGLSNSGFEKVEIEGGRIYMPPQIKLDLGAVGKGIACDEIRSLLSEEKSVTGAVVSIGGSILTYGEKSDGSRWRVAIQHPRMEGESIAVLQLQGDWCVSTSGDYERYIEKDGIRYHHIIDPKTGYPADNGLISVTIVSESGILSDALSTACFVLGKEAGLDLAEEYGAEAYIVDKDMNVYMTEGMDKLLVLR